VLVAPGSTETGPPFALRIASTHAAATSVFHTTVTESVVTSCRYGPRVRVAAEADVAVRSRSSSRAWTGYDRII
jgi:hypothetical protein